MRTYGNLYSDAAPPPRSAPLIDGGSWTVTSDRWADVDYTVTRSPDGYWGCDCPGFRYGARADGLCKHVDRVQGWLAEDPLATGAAAVLSWWPVITGRDMAEQDAGFLESRGWDMSRSADVCYLDCAAPGYLKTMTDASGRAWEIILCPADALVLEAGVADGDYAAALTPEDSRAGAWPWMPVVAAS